MANESNVDELLDGQSALESAVRQYIAQLSLQLRVEDNQVTRDKINGQIAKLVPIYIRLTGDGIAIIAARSKDDVANIKAVSADVQQFIYSIKRIEKMLTVATSIVKFVVVCLSDTKDPAAIFKAGKEVYEVMNATIEKEVKKGANAAITLKQLMAPSLIEG